MAVGLWNLFPGSVLNPKIDLDGKYTSADFYNCEGTLNGDTITLKEEILPYSFAFVTVYK